MSQTTSNYASSHSGAPLPLRVAVVGAGISGLVAAYRLTELSQQRNAGLELSVVDASPRAGGVINTIRRDGFLIEAGPDGFVTDKPWALSLCKRIGLEDQLISTNERHRGAMVVREGRLVPIPPGFVLMAPGRIGSILRSPLFSWRGKLRIAMEPMVRAKRAVEDESLESFVMRRLGREALDRLVQPLVGGIYTADAQKLSVLATFPRFLEMERTHGSLMRGMRHVARDAAHRQSTGARYSLFVTLRDGMRRLIDALVDQVGPAVFRLNTTVDSIERTNDQWVLHCSGGPSHVVDGLLLATPSHVAAPLVTCIDRTLGDAIGRLRTASSVVVNLAYDRAAVGNALDTFGFVVPAHEGRSIIAGGFSSIKYAGRAPQGAALLRAFAGGELRPDIVDMGQDALVDMVCREFEDLLSITGRPRFAMVHRYARAMPQYDVGHVARVSDIAAQATRHHGLALIGAAYDGVGIPDCVRAAEEAAQRVFDQLMSKDTSV